MKKIIILTIAILVFAIGSYAGGNPERNPRNVSPVNGPLIVNDNLTVNDDLTVKGGDTFYQNDSGHNIVVTQADGVSAVASGCYWDLFNSTGNNDICVDVNGNMGIGDITPTFKLDVDGTFRSTGAARVGDFIIPAVAGAAGECLKSGGSGSPGTFGACGSGSGGFGDASNLEILIRIDGSTDNIDGIDGSSHNAATNTTTYAADYEQAFTGNSTNGQESNFLQDTDLGTGSITLGLQQWNMDAISDWGNNEIKADIEDIVSRSITFKISSDDGTAFGTGLAFSGARIPWDVELTDWTMWCCADAECDANLSAATTVDIWVNTYANLPHTNADSVTGGNEPTIGIGAMKNTGTITGNWGTQDFTAGDVFWTNVDANTDGTTCTLELKGYSVQPN